jgi:hypothetical protein
VSIVDRKKNTTTMETLLARWLCCLYLLAAVVVEAAETPSLSKDDENTSYVFLQKFPLENTNNWLFHTEVLVCPRQGFGSTEQDYLDQMLQKIGQDSDDSSFVEIPEDFWSKQNGNCMEFGYGGASCSERCCGSPHTEKEVNFPLNERRAVIGNADTTQKSLFLYGTSGSLTGEQAHERLCPTNVEHHECWSNWAGTDYNPLTNNCNTFTSTLLHCVFGLSEKKPNLGPSDIVTVTCDKCPASAEESFTMDH